MQRRTLFFGLTVLFLLVAAGLTLALNQKPALRGAVLNPALPAPEISLLDQHGQPFQLSRQRGKVVLVYFGFVNCPEECPLTMAHFKQALEILGESASEVQVVMVSTDPVRDTPQALGAFLANFNPSFLGLPGSPEQLAKIWKDYEVEVFDGGETHSSYTYVIDRHGYVVENFVPDSSPEDLAADLKALLAEK